MESPAPQSSTGAASTPSESIVAPAKPESSSLPLGKPPKAPPGYKIVKARKNGKIVYARQKLTPEELAATSESSPTTTTQALASSLQVIKTTDSKASSTKTGSGSQAETSTTDAKQDGATKPNSKGGGAKETAATSGASVKIDSSKAANDTPDAKPTEQVLSKEAALHQQDTYFKRRRRHQFKNALLSGFARAVGSATIDSGDVLDGHGNEHDGASEDDHSGASDDDDDPGAGNSDGEAREYGDGDNNSHSGGHHIDAEKSSSHDHVTFNVGTAANVVATGLAGQPPRPPPPSYVAGATDKDDDKKNGAKVTIEDLDKMDKKLDQKARDGPLLRHWFDFSFYLMASLSVVLPVLFLVLCIMIAKMDNRSVNSSWGHMQDAIKVGISAWPIVFAAVVAQAFKTYATYRVERGIKLLELEQLVGSSSFASAVKQPFVLRRLNMLTLFMFIVWCLSPIGSQALQRTYYLERAGDIIDDTVWLAPQVGTNRMLSPGWQGRMDNDTYANLWQLMSLYFGAIFPPLGVDTDGASQDQYNHPLLRVLSPDNSATLFGGYGVPLGLPPSLVDPGSIPSTTQNGNTLSPYEILGFNVTSSLYNFTCDTPWIRKQQQDIADTMAFSSSGTLGINFTSNGPGSGINHVVFATNVNASLGDGYNASIGDTAYFMTIECDFEQLFVNMSVYCDVNEADEQKSGLWNCRGDSEPVFIADPPSQWYTVLRDFSEEFVQMGSPATFMTPTTPIELVSETYQFANGTPYRPTEASILADSPPAKFASNFRYVFNTWVTLGHCPECVAITDAASVRAITDPAVYGLYYWTDAVHDLGQDLVFHLSWPWVGTIIAASAVLLLVGAASVVLESMLVAPDTLGYVSSAARNSRYLTLPKTTTGRMGGAERARRLGELEVMMQEVKAGAGVGKIVLGNKTDKSVRLAAGRVYR